MLTVNITLKMPACEITNFERYLNEHLDVIKFKIIPDTEKLYETDETFKKLVKEVKKVQRIRDIYINDHN